MRLCGCRSFERIRAPVESAFVRFFAFMIIEKHSMRGRFQVIILTAADLHRKRNDGNQSNDQGNRNRNVKNAHRDPCRLTLGIPARSESATTVSELIGIKIAATNGLINPKNAKAANVAL